MNTQEQAQLEEKLTEFLMDGGTLQDVYGISNEQLEVLYAKGFQEYSARQYDKAIETFSYLLNLRPNEKRYLFAFGAILQVIKEYKKAIFYYSLAANEDMMDPTITLHIVECLIALQMKGDALKMLDVLIQETASQPQWSNLYAQAIGYQTLLRQKKTTEK